VCVCDSKYVPKLDGSATRAKLAKGLESMQACHKKTVACDPTDYWQLIDTTRTLELFK
jgi:hypothetical protein